MFAVKSQRGTNNTVDFRAEGRRAMVKPAIQKTFHEGKGKDRVRYYMTIDGRTFIADVFDRVFTPAVQVVVHGKRHKNKSIDARVID